ncbi:MAG: LLM class flavin-dependent oxidoreductase [Conexivisphaerales archaeon]
MPFYPVELILNTAMVAEKVGFDSVWTADHMVGISIDRRDCYSAWSLLSAIAIKTDKVMLGTSVSDPCRFHPATMAQFAMTLQELSAGRFIFGLGAGEAQNTLPYGIDCSNPVSKLEEAMKVMKLLFTGNEVSYTGRYFMLKGASLRPGSRDKAIPIWIAGNSKRTLELTARYADGWIPLGVIFNPDAYREALNMIESIRSKEEKANKFEPCLFLHVAIDKDEKQAQSKAEYAGKLQVLGWAPDVYSELSEEQRKKLNFSKLVFDEATSSLLKEILNKIPIEPVLERTVVGSPAQCLEKISRYIDAGAKHIIISFMGGNNKIRDSIDLFAREVIGYYKDSNMADSSKGTMKNQD